VAQAAINGLTLTFEEATPEHIGLHLPVTRALSSNSRVLVRYKETAEAIWRNAHPLLRIHPEWNNDGAPVTPVDPFAGTIFDLTPGTAYDIELTLEEPGQPDQTFTITASTRSLPPGSPSANVTATPGNR
jgi:hypothetical protein